MGLGSHPYMWFNLNHLFKGLVSKCSHIEVMASTYEFGEATMQSITPHQPNFALRNAAS